MLWILIDQQATLPRHWSRTFANTPVEAVTSDIVQAAQGSAWVSPANSFGWMDGGLDWTIRQAYDRAGCDITALVQAAIRDQAGGELPVGQALIVPTPNTPYTHLIVAPTMRTPRPAFWTLNAYLAFRAILLTVRRWKARHPEDPMAAVYCPGLATGVGKMPSKRCARQMRAAWDQVMTPPNALPSLGTLTAQELWWRHG